MKKVSILNCLYNELCDKIIAPLELKEKTQNCYEKIIKRLKKLTSNELEAQEIAYLIDEFIDKLDQEFEYERNAVYKVGYDTCNSLKVECNQLKVIIGGTEIILDNKDFEELYDERVEEVATINEAEKERDKAQIKSITFKELAPKLSKEKIENIEMAIDEYMDSVYCNFGEYNKKYYYNGIKDSFGLRFVYSKK